MDDDFAWRALYRLDLGPGHDIVAAGDAREALAVLRDQPADLIVLDYHLPGMSGAALLKLLRARGITAPVILCTADPQHASRETSETVVAKETDLRQLRRTIELTLAAQPASDPGRAA